VADTPADLDSHLGRLMGMAAKAMRARLDHILSQSELDLRADHMILLGFVAEHEGINQQRIAEHFFHDKTAMTRLIDALEERKLVVRKPDKADRRQNLIYLTAAGKQIGPRLRAIATETEKAALKGISRADVKLCKEVLRQVNRNLGGWAS